MHSSYWTVSFSFLALMLPGCGKANKQGGETSAGAARPTDPKSVAPGGGVSERDQVVNRSCELRAAGECVAKARAAPAYFQSESQKIAASPFDFSIARVWLKGSCAKGDKPEKRQDADGLKLIGRSYPFVSCWLFTDERAGPPFKPCVRISRTRLTGGVSGRSITQPPGIGRCLAGDGVRRRGSSRAPIVSTRPAGGFVPCA